MISQALKDYGDALEAHLTAQREEAVSKDKVRKTRYALMMARQNLKMVEEDILEDNLKDL